MEQTSDGQNMQRFLESPQTKFI